MLDLGSWAPDLDVARVCEVAIWPPGLSDRPPSQGKVAEPVRGSLVCVLSTLTKACPQYGPIGIPCEVPYRPYIAPMGD